jgi:DNA-binding cell septation regulator SpoVG
MNDLQKILLRLRAWTDSTAPIDNIVQGMNQGKSAMQNRIFNSEQGTKDVSGRGLGTYSDPYKKYRQKRGRQTAHVDLELTGSLRRDIKVIQENAKVAIAVPSSVERAKIGYLEKQFSTTIFDITTDEKQEIMDVIEYNFGQDIKQIINGVN